MGGGSEKTGPEQPAVRATDADNDTVWYFAIGSMMLPKSYALRDFVPLESHPAELNDFRLGFFGPMGFAEAISSAGESLHGVIHKVTHAQMLELDKVEVGYIRQTGTARPYGIDWGQTSDNQDDPKLVLVTVYCRPEGDNKEEDNRPPKQRYLEILIAGAKHYRVERKYVKFLENHPFQPRTSPEEFQNFGNPPPDRHFTEIPQSTEDRLYFALNRRVIEACYPPDHKHGNFLRHMLQKFGPHFEVGLSQLALDLKYDVVKDIKDCTPEHSAYLEDSHYRFMKKAGDVQYYKVLGSYSLPEE